MAPKKLSPAQKRMLLRLLDSKEGYELTPGGNRAQALSAAAWYRTAAILLSLGLITKSPAGGGALIRLTDKGRALALILKPA